MNLKGASFFAFIILIMTIFGLIIRKSFIGDGLIALALQIAAIFIMIWARLSFGVRSFHATANPTEGGLVTKGPYRFIRHPIYAAVIYFIWAGALSHFSIINIALAVIATAAIAVRIIAEENLLLQRYPEYAAYAARTRRIVPFLL